MRKPLYTGSFVLLLFSLFLPLGVFKVLIASVILLFYPGFLISRYLFSSQDLSKAFLVSPLVGASFWIVGFYSMSACGLVRSEPVIIISLVSAVLLDVRGNYPQLRKWMVPLVVCMAFSSLYFCQWNTTLIPPLDDAKFHSFFVVTIEDLHRFPHTYGVYTEIPCLTYPLGYHALLSVIKGLSRQDLFPAVTLSTWFLLLWAPVCFYVFTLRYGHKTAVFSAFSFSFLSIFFHRLEQTSTYPNLLAIELFILSLYALREVLEDFSLKKAVIASLLIASAVETHIYVLFLFAPFLALYGLYISTKKDIVSLKRITVIILFFGLFLIPYGARFRLYTPSEEELSYFREWYSIESIADTKRLSAALSSMSPLLVLLSVVSIPILKTKKDLALLFFLLASTLIIPALSVLKIDYPGWYSISPNRFLEFAFIPLCIFSGIGIGSLASAFGEKKVLTILVIMSVVLHFTDTFYPWSQFGDVSEINPPDDMDVIQFMKTLPPDCVILNFSTLRDPSGWIPSVAKRMTFLPPFSLHRGDGCIHYLKTPERLSDMVQYLYQEQLNSPQVSEFVRKYSIDYVFITSHRPCVGNQQVDPELFLDSPFYTSVYRKGNSHLLRVDIPSPENAGPLIIVGGPTINPTTDEFNSIFGITYWLHLGKSFEIFCEGKSIYLDLANYPDEDICIIYRGEHDSREVILIWGYGWEGTSAGSAFIRNVGAGKKYADARVLMLRWVDFNGDGLVQLGEVAVESEVVQEHTTESETQGNGWLDHQEIFSWHRFRLQ